MIFNIIEKIREKKFDLLKTVVTLARDRSKDKKSNITTLDPSIRRLGELYDKGLLEPYILLVRADRGIAADYRDYLTNHRDKLRQYVVEYVLTGGGK